MKEDGRKMKLGLMLPVKPDIRWVLARQVGVEYAITKAAPELSGQLPPWDFESLRSVKARFAEQGVRLWALEGDEFDMSRIKLGLPGRDEDIEHYRMMLKNMGRLEIPLLCLNFMAGVGWYRTRVDLPERGGALTSEFDRAAMPSEPELKLSHEELWSNFEYFIRAVIPAAEEAGVKMGLHPDDPPIDRLCGYPRILTSAAAFRRALALAESPNLGVTFCQANFRAMGEDVPALIEEFCRKKQLFFFHFRDIEGIAEHFRETFHDNGPTDMAKLLKLLKENGFDGILRPDHTPTMATEENCEPGYAMLGNLFAVGYIRGILDALKTIER